MNRSRLPLLWLVLPSVVFFLLLAAFVVRLSRREQVATEAPVVSPTPVVFPQSPPQTTSGLASLIGQIAGWRADDPRLAAPIFERQISLPAE